MPEQSGLTAQWINKNASKSSPGAAFRVGRLILIKRSYRRAGARRPFSSLSTARNAAPICRRRISCGARGRRLQVQLLPRETPRLFVDAAFRAVHGVGGSRSSFSTAQNAAPIYRRRISCGARGRNFCCEGIPTLSKPRFHPSEAFQSLPLSPKSKLCTQAFPFPTSTFQPFTLA